MSKSCAEEIEKIKADILIDLLKHRKVGQNHTSIDNIVKSFPPRNHKNVKKVRNQLIRDHFINCKPTGYGKQCSINSEKIEDIISMPKIIEASKTDEPLKTRIKQFYPNFEAKFASWSFKLL